MCVLRVTTPPQSTQATNYVSLQYKGLSHRNRLAGYSQSVSKFSREIEPAHSQQCVCSHDRVKISIAHTRGGNSARVGGRGDTLYNLSWLGCRDAKRRSLESQALSLTESHQSHTLCLRPTLFHTVNFYGFYSSPWEQLVSFYLPLVN